MIRFISGTFLLFALALIAVACGASKQSPEAAPRAEAAEGRATTAAGPFDRQKQDIHDLWLQIREWRVEMGWRTEPPREMTNQLSTMSVRQLRVCPDDPAPNTNTCQDVCSIREAICDNAESICRIAGDLEGDSWARDKCNSAKASCRQATERCCQCVIAEESTTGAGDSDVIGP